MRPFLICLICLAVPQILLSQETNEPASEQQADTLQPTIVTYSADQVEYTPSTGRMVLRDGAQVKYKDITVEADTIRFDSKPREVFAEGTPVLMSGNDTLYGRRMGYELETKRGFVESGRTKIEKGWLTGELIRVVGENTFNIDHGTFTTCEHDPPHYCFVSRRMKVYANDMAVCEPVVLKVRAVPVLAVPFWFFPIKKGRHSGLLIPKVGRSSAEGKYVKRVAYYWVVNDYSDLTFSLDYMEKKGPMVKVDGVYIVKPILSGGMTGSFLNEQDTDRRRWSFGASHQHTLWGGVRLSGQADFVSDESYNVDYEEETIVQLNRQLKSYLSLKKSWSGAIAEVVLDRTEDFQRSIVTEKLPRAALSLSSRPLLSPRAGEPARWYHSLYLSYQGLAINSREKEEELETHKAVDNRLNFTFPQKVFTYLTFSPALTLRETVYDRDTLGVRYPWRHHYTASANLGTVIYGLSRGGIGMAKEFRHVVRPSISYIYAPEIDQSRYFSFAGIEEVGPANNISLSLGNDFQAKFERGGETRKLDLATLNFAASYSLAEGNRRFSNITSTLDINPTPLIDIRATSTHDPYTRTLKSLNVTTGLRLQGESGGEEGRSPYSLDLAHSYAWGAAGPAAQQLWGGIGFNLTRNWKVDYRMRYDLTEGQVVDRTLYIYRDLHCWEADFSWSSYGEKWRYDFKIRIKAVPEIKLGKGVLGILVP